jgi:peroxin-13
MGSTYNSYGGMSGLSRYSSPYSRFGGMGMGNGMYGGMGGSMYGGMGGSMYGAYGGYGGMGYGGVGYGGMGDPNDPNSLSRRMEAGTQGILLPVLDVNDSNVSDY